MFHFYFDTWQAFETCPGHPLLPLDVVNKDDGDHQWDFQLKLSVEMKENTDLEF